MSGFPIQGLVTVLEVHGSFGRMDMSGVLTMVRERDFFKPTRRPPSFQDLSGRR